MIYRTLGAILSVFIILLGAFYLTNNDINYGIDLVDDSVPQDTIVTISYEIRNEFFSGEKNNVQFHYYIKGQTTKQTELVGNMVGGQTEKGAVDISTVGTPSGEYTVMTILEYWISGKGHMKFLTLELTIY